MQSNTIMMTYNIYYKMYVMQYTNVWQPNKKCKRDIILLCRRVSCGCKTRAQALHNSLIRSCVCFIVVWRVAGIWICLFSLPAFAGCFSTKMPSVFDRISDHNRYINLADLNSERRHLPHIRIALWSSNLDKGWQFSIIYQ